MHACQYEEYILIFNIGWLFFIFKKYINYYSLCPTFMTIFIDLVLQTPPSWFSKPSIVPFEVAEEDKEKMAITIRVHADLKLMGGLSNYIFW